MGARVGWRWISVVVMGRLPVRLSLWPTRGYGLQDKRRRVRITPAVHSISVGQVPLFQFGPIDDLDLAENLCDQERARIPLWSAALNDDIAAISAGNA